MKTMLMLIMMSTMVVAIGCEKKVAEPEAKPAATVQQQEEAVMAEKETKTFTEPKEAAVEAGKTYTTVITTNKGKVVCELYATDAPISVTNFKQLADGGYYKGLSFHRVVPGFVIQGGDPTATGSGGPGYTTPAEIKRPHPKGALAWARTGDEVNPERRNSGSQFYITLEPTPFLDNAYTVFGQVTEGMDVVESIRQGDVIETIEVKAE